MESNLKYANEIIRSGAYALSINNNNNTLISYDFGYKTLDLIN